MPIQCDLRLESQAASYSILLSLRASLEPGGTRSYLLPSHDRGNVVSKPQSAENALRHPISHLHRFKRWIGFISRRSLQQFTAFGVANRSPSTAPILPYH